ncbi:3-isopropylmalate dehydratase large subunit [Cupriavidus necator]|uniref:3-isopropylmalate dehydratase, large subunit n=1 Tax=Cupriavidus pinatubonensis (strain JMP 134 / LMG 1197) TaxID=264198 RepID=Q46RP3_CUPPJ|nr:3-isopropylmalate dehydratase large subunit [Cupriavidus necator]
MAQVSAQAVAAATPQTLAQKLLARASGRAHVTPGEIVTCRVDLAMMHDSGGPRRVKPLLEKIGARVWDPSRVVVVTDHYVPAHDADSRKIVQIAREWVREEGVARFHDMEGICHVVVPQKGYLRPGMMAVGGDSHSSTGGAFGTYMFGIGATEMLGVLVTGEIWVRVPQTLRMQWHGRLRPGVSAKDMMLRMCTQFGMDGGQYQAVEYAGTAVSALSMQERMTLSNMTAELGAQVGLVAPDAVTRDWLLDAGVEPSEIDVDRWQSDAGAACLATHDFDAASLAPQVSRPHTPADASDVDSLGNVAVNIAYIGACTGAKLDDLRMAAQVLRGQRVARNSRLLVAPASAADQAQAEREGTLGALVAAGAELLPNACGACAGYGEHRFGEDTVVISTTARNFKGRMGAASSQVYLGSPYTVAASAIAGRIADPRGMLS